MWAEFAKSHPFIFAMMITSVAAVVMAGICTLMDKIDGEEFVEIIGSVTLLWFFAGIGYFLLEGFS